MLAELNEGALQPSVHGPLIQELYAKLGLVAASPGQGTSEEDGQRSVATSWQRVDAAVDSADAAADTSSSRNAALRRHNGDVRA